MTFEGQSWTLPIADYRKQRALGSVGTRDFGRVSPSHSLLRNWQEGHPRPYEDLSMVLKTYDESMLLWLGTQDQRLQVVVHCRYRVLFWHTSLNWRHPPSSFGGTKKKSGWLFYRIPSQPLWSRLEKVSTQQTVYSVKPSVWKTRGWVARCLEHATATGRRAWLGGDLL